MMVVKSYEELGRSPKVGDRVMISQNAANHRRWSKRMERFVGTVMTIRGLERFGDVIKMKEDIDDFYGNSTPGWNWYLPMIEGIIIDCVEEVDEDPSVWTSGLTIDDLLTS